MKDFYFYVFYAVGRYQSKNFDPSGDWSNPWGTAIMTFIQCLILEAVLFNLKLLGIVATLPHLPRSSIYFIAIGLLVVNHRLAVASNEYNVRFAQWPREKQSRWDTMVGLLLAVSFGGAFIMSAIIGGKV